MSNEKINLTDVSPLKDTNGSLCDHYEITFSSPVNGEWLYEFIQKGLDEYFKKLEERKNE